MADQGAARPRPRPYRGQRSGGTVQGVRAQAVLRDVRHPRLQPGSGRPRPRHRLGSHPGTVSTAPRKHGGTVNTAAPVAQVLVGVSPSSSSTFSMLVREFFIDSPTMWTMVG